MPNSLRAFSPPQNINQQALDLQSALQLQILSSWHAPDYQDTTNRTIPACSSRFSCRNSPGDHVLYCQNFMQVWPRWFCPDTNSNPHTQNLGCSSSFLPPSVKACLLERIKTICSSQKSTFDYPLATVALPLLAPNRNFAVQGQEISAVVQWDQNVTFLL